MDRERPLRLRREGLVNAIECERVDLPAWRLTNDGLEVLDQVLAATRGWLRPCGIMRV